MRGVLEADPAALPRPSRAHVCAFGVLMLPAPIPPTLVSLRGARRERAQDRSLSFGPPRGATRCGDPPEKAATERLPTTTPQPACRRFRCRRRCRRRAVLGEVAALPPAAPSVLGTAPAWRGAAAAPRCWPAAVCCAVALGAPSDQLKRHSGRRLELKNFNVAALRWETGLDKTKVAIAVEKTVLARARGGRPPNAPFALRGTRGRRRQAPRFAGAAVLAGRWRPRRCRLPSAELPLCLRRPGPEERAARCAHPIPAQQDGEGHDGPRVTREPQTEVGRHLFVYKKQTLRDSSLTKRSTKREIARHKQTHASTYVCQIGLQITTGTEIFEQTLAAETRPEHRAALLLMFLTSGRVGCVLSLRKKDLTFHNDALISVVFRCGKGVKQRGPYTVHTNEKTLLRTLAGATRRGRDSNIKSGAAFDVHKSADVRTTISLTRWRRLPQGRGSFKKSRKKYKEIRIFQNLKAKNLPGRELNPGHPRDRRVYLPLYYRELV